MRQFHFEYFSPFLRQPLIFKEMSTSKGNPFAELQALRDALAFGAGKSNKSTAHGKQLRAWLKLHPDLKPLAVELF